MVTRRQFTIGAIGATALSVAPVRLRCAKGAGRDDVKCVWPAGAALGDGPIWDKDEEAVYWVDIEAPAVHRFTPATGATRTWPMPEAIGCIARRRSGGFVAALRSGFAFIDLETGRIEPIVNPERRVPRKRFNDGKCDPAGRFWAGTIGVKEGGPTGALYRLDPDLRWSRMDGGYLVPNGPAFGPDGRTMYHADSTARTIYAFDLAADGSISNRRIFRRFSKEDGVPDGMTVDAEGGLWVAHWDGWRLSRLLPDGTIDKTIELPVAKVTSCVFGGPDLETLFVTSASIGLDEAERSAQPLAGGLFAVSVGVKGLPTQRFAG
jgi:sugar lactone lactonase YvrE